MINKINLAKEQYKHEINQKMLRYKNNKETIIKQLRKVIQQLLFLLKCVKIEIMKILKGVQYEL